MADEPTLQKGQSGEWVKYLQQVMAHYQFWNGVADGEFGDDLEAAVIRVQQTYGITTDGVVRAATWAVLTGVPATSAEHGLHGTGAHASEHSETSVGGLPAFKMSFIGQSTLSYELQCEHTEAHIEGSVDYELEVEVTPHQHSDPVPTDEHSWLSEHSGTLLGVGVVVLVVVVAVALVPETGGGSLVLLAAPAL